MHASSTSIAVIMLLAALLSSRANSAELVHHPESITDFMGRDSIFYCRGYMFSVLSWRYNGNNPAAKTAITGVQESPLNVSGDTLSSELLVPGIHINNGSTIRCYGFRFNVSNLPVNFTISPPAQLLLQGPPDKVMNFRGTNTSSTTIVLSWQPPYHLPGTTCCTQYHINVTHNNGTEIFNDNITTTSMTFTVPEDRLCDTYIVSIVAYNPAGEGDLFLTAWSLAGFFELDSVTHDLYYSREDLLLDVDITIEGYCLNQVDNVTLSTACLDSYHSTTRTTNDVLASTTDRSYTTDFRVGLTREDDQCYYEVALDNNIAALRQDISTYDVSSASIESLSPGEVCLSCQYLRNSLARGCEIEVNNNEFDDDRYRDTLLQDDTVVCVSVEYGGSFTINVYDINDDGTRSARPAVIFTDVTIEDPTIDRNIGTTEAMTTAFTENAAFGGIVAALVVVVVVCILLLFLIIIVVVVYKKKQSKSVPSSPLFDSNNIRFDGRNNTISFVEAANDDDVFGSGEVANRIVDLLSGIESDHGNRFFNIRSDIVDGKLRVEIAVNSTE